MKTFSQRKGLKAINQIIQIDGMSQDLRTSLWNALELVIWGSPNFLHADYGQPYIYSFSRLLWCWHFKKPIDSRPEYPRAILSCIRDHFFACEWNEVYDLIEYLVGAEQERWPDLVGVLNYVLEREVAGYRIVGGCVVDIISEQEIEMLEEALSDTQFLPVAAHLQRALEFLSDRKNPDYRNSVKESISAVESMAKTMSGNSKATLPDALKELEKRKKLHSALKDGFIKLYGYTSDGDGIRHAMLEESSADSKDARFFLLSCTSFVNYLKAQ